jgi:aromatic ring-opening dioxygenase LigB subunit
MWLPSKNYLAVLTKHLKVAADISMHNKLHKFVKNFIRSSKEDSFQHILLVHGIMEERRENYSVKAFTMPQAQNIQ